jgi:molecular chaperone DnaK
VQEQAPLDRVRALTTELQQVFHGLGAATGSGSGDRPQGSDQAGPAAGDDDVIDADFTVS